MEGMTKVTKEKMPLDIAKVTYIKTGLTLKEISELSGISERTILNKSKEEKWSFLKKEYKSELEQKYKYLLEVEHKEYSRKFYELARVKAFQMLEQCTSPYNLQLLVKAFTDADNGLVAIRLSEGGQEKSIEEKQESFLMTLARL